VSTVKYLHGLGRKNVLAKVHVNNDGNQLVYRVEAVDTVWVGEVEIGELAGWGQVDDTLEDAKKHLILCLQMERAEITRVIDAVDSIYTGQN
jgi:hypothetical protein